MKITRVSIWSGKEHTLDIPVTQEQLEAWYNGARIQDVMHNLTPEQCEFIMSGITEEEWENVYPSNKRKDLDFPRLQAK